MQLSATAIMAAATIAAAITILTSPSAPVVATPAAKPVADAISACTNRPWPYLHCVGTEFGSKQVRLVSTDRY